MYEYIYMIWTFWWVPLTLWRESVCSTFTEMATLRACNWEVEDTSVQWRWCRKVTNTALTWPTHGYKPQRMQESTGRQLPRNARTARSPWRYRKISKESSRRSYDERTLQQYLPPHTLHFNRRIWDLRYTREQSYWTLTSTGHVPTFP